MKLHDCITFSFKDALARIKSESALQASHYLILHHGDTTKPLWQQHLCTNSHFCRTVVANGYLTEQQMQRAALRYRLGMARDGGVIFWQIDHAEHVYDGKIMYYKDNCHRDHNHNPTWVSAELKHFYLNDDYPYDCLPHFSHCLFGTHLLQEDSLDSCDLCSEKTSVPSVVEKNNSFNSCNSWLENPSVSSVPSVVEKNNSFNSCNSWLENTSVSSVPFSDQGAECGVANVVEKNNSFNSCNSWLEKTSVSSVPSVVNLKPVAVVEAEKTAIICSERYPDFIWLAPGGLEALKPEMMFPLRERKVILFPDTDETGETYRKWYAIARSAQRLLGHPIYVSSFLELHATEDQKRRKIDLVDYIFDSHTDLTDPTDLEAPAKRGTAIMQGGR